MGDAGFFRGTNTDQDSRFPDKEKKLMKQLKFEDALSKKINMSKINLDVIKPWITAKINEILGMEDDVVVEFIMSQLETKNIDPKRMQINITGFLNARCARIFMGELWELLAEANESEDGIPKSLVDKKMAELKKEGNGEANDRKIIKEEAQGDWNKRYDKLSLGRYSGPTREKRVRDDRIVTSPRSRRRRPSRSRSPRRNGSRSPKRNGRDRSPDRRRDSGRRREDRSPDPEKEAESKRREEERIKRHAEQRRREEEVRDRRDDRKRDDERRDRKHDRKRSRSPASPVRRRFTEGEDRRRRSPVDSDEEDKKKRRSRNDSEDDHHKRKEKKEKKHKKEKKKKERKRTPTPSSSSSSSDSD